MSADVAPRGPCARRTTGGRERPCAASHWSAGSASWSAAAAAAEDRIALDQLVIQQLPELLRAAAQGLKGANLTVLDGAEGLNGVVASLAAQGLALLDAVRKGMGPVPAGEPAAPGLVERRPE